MKEKNNGIMICLILCILIIIGLVGFIFYDRMSDNSSNNVETNNNDGNNIVEQNDLIEENYVYGSEYFKKVDYDYTVNGKKHKIAFLYSLGDILDMDEVEGYKYGIYLTLGIDGKVLDFTKELVAETKTNDEINQSSIYEKYNLEDIKLIKGTDNNEYMVLLIDYMTYVGNTINPIIIDDSGNLIEKIDLNDGTGVMVPGNEHYGNWEEYYLTNDALYFLDMTCGNWKFNGNNIIVKEYKVTVSNNKTTRTQVNTYENAEGAGQGC